MTRTLLLLLFAGLALAQDGERLFAQTCGSGYCHNGRGVGGGAPRLAARGFDLAYIRSTVSNGVPGTSMPAFGPNLPAADVTAIVNYVASLNGITPLAGRGGGAPAAAAPQLSADALRGRALFADAVRGFGRCSTCHEAGGLGIPIAPPMFDIPADANALRSLATPRVSTVTVDGQSMPALILAARSASVVFYDLTVPPPVKRTVTAASFSNQEGSSWRHASVTTSYSDAELGAVLTFLRAVAK